MWLPVRTDELGCPPSDPLTVSVMSVASVVFVISGVSVVPEISITSALTMMGMLSVGRELL